MTCRFCPRSVLDKGVNINKPGITEYIKKLGEAAGVDITDFSSLKEACLNRPRPVRVVWLPHRRPRLRRVSQLYLVQRIRSRPHLQESARFRRRRRRRRRAVQVQDTASLPSSRPSISSADSSCRFTSAFCAIRTAVCMKLRVPDTGFDTIGNYDMIGALSRLLDRMDSGRRAAENDSLFYQSDRQSGCRGALRPASSSRATASRR